MTTELNYGLINSKSSYAGRALKEQSKDVEALLGKLPHSNGTISLEGMRPSAKLRRASTERLNQPFVRLIK